MHQALSITKFIYEQLDPYDKGVDYVCFMTKVWSLVLVSPHPSVLTFTMIHPPKPRYSTIKGAKTCSKTRFLSINTV